MQSGSSRWRDPSSFFPAPRRHAGSFGPPACRAHRLPLLMRLLPSDWSCESLVPERGDRRRVSLPEFDLRKRVSKREFSPRQGRFIKRPAKHPQDTRSRCGKAKGIPQGPDSVCASEKQVDSRRPEIQRFKGLTRRHKGTKGPRRNPDLSILLTSPHLFFVPSCLCVRHWNNSREQSPTFVTQSLSTP